MHALETLHHWTTEPSPFSLLTGRWEELGGSDTPASQYSRVPLLLYSHCLQSLFCSSPPRQSVCLPFDLFPLALPFLEPLRAALLPYGLISVSILDLPHMAGDPTSPGHQTKRRKLPEGIKGIGGPDICAQHVQGVVFVAILKETRRGAGVTYGARTLKTTG